VSPWTQGIAWLHCFPYLCRLRTDHCISHRGKSHIYYPEHILLYGHLKDLLLSCRRSGSFRTDCQGFIFGGGGPCTTLSPGLRGGGLESQFGRGPGHPGHESDELVLLMPGVQAGRVFSGYPVGDIGPRIAAESV
jgi:hypothetical protein